ncbi:hypothetical protein GJAV_G00190030, partial [Gymnothorax javanicus]
MPPTLPIIQISVMGNMPIILFGLTYLALPWLFKLFVFSLLCKFVLLHLSLFLSLFSSASAFFVSWFLSFWSALCVLLPSGCRFAFIMTVLFCFCSAVCLLVTNLD